MEKNSSKNTKERSSQSFEKKAWVKPTVEVISRDTIENGATTRLQEGTTTTVVKHTYHS